MIKLEPAPPEPTKTKITGTAHVGYVKDNKSAPPNQKVKAVTATIPSIGGIVSGDEHGSVSSPEQQRLQFMSARVTEVRL